MREIASLLKRAEKYLKSSKILIETGDYESSVSRSYYAMHYAAEALLLTKDLSFSSHGGVISAFGEHFIKTDIFQKEMGKELNRAFEKRQLGDYEHTFIITKDEAQKLLEKSRNFVEKITQYLEEKKYL